MLKQSRCQDNEYNMIIAGDVWIHLVAVFLLSPQQNSSII